MSARAFTVGHLLALLVDLGLPVPGYVPARPSPTCKGCGGIGLVNHPATGAIEPCAECDEGHRQADEADRRHTSEEPR